MQRYGEHEEHKERVNKWEECFHFVIIGRKQCHAGSCLLSLDFRCDVVMLLLLRDASDLPADLSGDRQQQRCLCLRHSPSTTDFTHHFHRHAR